jgi:hypothetical protein
VRRTDRRHVHRQFWVLAYKHAGRPGVVKMDVRQQQVLDIREPKPAGPELDLKRFDARRRAAVDERPSVLGIEQVRADHTRPTEVMEVE